MQQPEAPDKIKTITFNVDNAMQQKKRNPEREKKEESEDHSFTPSGVPQKH